MRKKLIAVTVCALLLAGCCSNPGVFQKIQASKAAVQEAYYTVKGESSLPSDQYVLLGGLAADGALMLAGTLQTQWCPSEADAAQLAEAVKNLPLVK